MDLKWTEEQDLLRATLRELLGRHASPEVVRELEDKPDGYPADLWRELAALDVLGVRDYGALDLVVVCEELGRALAPTPFLETCVFGAALVGEEWRSRIAAGEAVLAPAWYEPGRSEGPEGIAVAVSADGLVTGTKIRVPHAARADALLVLARNPDGAVEVLLVDPGSPGVEVLQTPVLGSSAEFEVTFTGAHGERVGVWADVEAALVLTRVAVAAYAAGAARRALELTVEYAKQRHQFDRPIGSFQGLAHPIADIATEVTGAEVLIHHVAWALDADRPPGPLPAMAKRYACDVWKRATKVGQQVFGGVGFTRVLDIQLYFRRAKQLELTWGGPALLDEELAAAELDAEQPWVTFGAAV